jgi:uncharacterized repeat protein (TIGR03847 family)
MSASFDLSHVDRITVGTVGPTGQRTFFLQARQAGELVTLKLEKQQVAALARHLADLLADLPSVGALPDDDELELETPAVAEWAIGSLEVEYDADVDEIVIVAEEIQVIDEEGNPVDDDGSGGRARLAATREQIAALAIRGTALVEAGRPPCPLCGYPLDPAGHSCPRTNGHRAPTL